MTEFVGIVGSRSYPDLPQVVEFLQALWQKYPDTVIVSGGAQGVDQMAEQTWLGFGGKVVSLRPRQDGYRNFLIVRWELGDANAKIFSPDYYLRWADWRSAALARNMFIVDETHRGVAFWDGRSWGTGNTIALYHDSGKPYWVRPPRVV